MFFLGAGASIEAGVPDTYSFVEEFIKSIQDRDKKEKIETIINKLKGRYKPKIDIEDLLIILFKLLNKDKEPLLYFCADGNIKLNEYYEKEPLITDLKNFIKKRGIVNESRIGYFGPFLQFIDEYGTLDVISVNYDICMEQFCKAYKRVYQDGFGAHWDPKTFEMEPLHIRLYKLHGSITWYQTDTWDYMKTDAMVETTKLGLYGGRSAENLVLYPIQKWDYAEPFLELLIRTIRVLESDSCKFLVVVGYSFRDDYIIRILWDVAKKNPELRLIFIDPRAYDIYLEKLKYYEDRSTPSSLNGKVICLPYRFERILPELKNNFLAGLKYGLHLKNVQDENERKGMPSEYTLCLVNFVNAGYTEESETILKDHPIISETSPMIYLEVILKLAVNLFLEGRQKISSGGFEIFLSMLEDIALNKLHIDFSGRKVALNFNYKPEGSFQNCESVYKLIENLYNFCDLRRQSVHPDTVHPDREHDLEEFTKGLKAFKDYLEPFVKDGMGLEDYKRTRDQMLVNEGFSSEFSQYQRNIVDNKGLSITSQWFADVERRILGKILKTLRVGPPSHRL